MRQGALVGSPYLLFNCVQISDELFPFLLQYELVLLAYLYSALTHRQLLQGFFKILLCLLQTRLQSEGIQRGYRLGRGDENC